MNWVIFIFGSGAAFFLGVALIVGGVAIMTFGRWKGLPLVATLFTAVGLILVVVSATPLPYWFYVAALVVSLVWIVVERVHWKSLHPNWRQSLRVAVVTLWLGSALAEVPFQRNPALQPMGRPTLYLLADSVSAGMGEAVTETWPDILARTQGIDVHNHSQMGATVASMLKKIKGTPLGQGIVLLEIGGNDLLGSTTAADFERNLDELLSLVSGPDREVVMFELPLTPFANGYGLAQRRLAAKHRAKLIPKRIFVGVLTADDATVDSIHLTRKGHERMAETVWAILGPAYGV
jgi:acyl-CoA thioesterase-1